MGKSGIESTGKMEHMEMVSIGMIIRRFGKDNLTDMLLTEREVDGHKEYFIQGVLKRLAGKSDGKNIINHAAVNEAIDITMPEFFKEAV